jgi:hypothetical protein
MQLPTRTVRRKADGHVCLINASDFDPLKHDDPDAPAPETTEDDPERADDDGEDGPPKRRRGAKK